MRGCYTVSLDLPVIGGQPPGSCDRFHMKKILAPFSFSAAVRKGPDASIAATAFARRGVKRPVSYSRISLFGRYTAGPGREGKSHSVGKNPGANLLETLDISRSLTHMKSQRCRGGLERLPQQLPRSARHAVGAFFHNAKALPPWLEGCVASSRYEGKMVAARCGSVPGVSTAPETLLKTYKAFGSGPVCSNWPTTRLLDRVSRVIPCYCLNCGLP